jgi:hypothetical protein
VREHDRRAPPPSYLPGTAGLGRGGTGMLQVDDIGMLDRAAGRIGPRATSGHHATLQPEAGRGRA